MRNTVWPYLRQFITARNTLVMATCIGIAAVFWLLQKMSLEYRYVIQVEALYDNAPEQVMLVHPLPPKLQLEITATGWQLFRYGLMFQLPTVHIDMEEYRNSRFLAYNNLRTTFTEQLNNRFQVESVFPAQTELEWQPQHTRKLPVQLVQEVSIDPQYGLVDYIRLSPDSVEVSGPYNFIDTLSAIYTDTLLLGSVSESQSGSLTLNRNYPFPIRLSPDAVDYQFEVEPYTEASLQLPITTGGPLASRITLLQQSVTVQFQLPVEAYGLLTDSTYLQLFEVIALSDSVGDNDSVLPLQLYRQPGNIRHVVLQPTHIRFLYRDL